MVSPTHKQELQDTLAERVMKWKKLESPSKEGLYWYQESGIGLFIIHTGYWNPFNVLGHAFILLEKYELPEYEWKIQNRYKSGPEKYGCFIVRIGFHTLRPYEGYGETIEEAICICILNLLEIEIDWPKYVSDN